MNKICFECYLKHYIKFYNNTQFQPLATIWQYKIFWSSFHNFKYKRRMKRFPNIKGTVGVANATTFRPIRYKVSKWNFHRKAVLYVLLINRLLQRKNNSIFFFFLQPIMPINLITLFSWHGKTDFTLYTEYYIYS